MFTKTFTFWRRLVSKAPSSESSGVVTEVQDDRRLWVRYTANINAQIQIGNENNKQRVAARVHDLSRGGANLQVEVPFESGQLITLELPTQADELRTVLACVVRVLPQGENAWALGCVFSRELNDEDLASFGARRVEHGEADQRRWTRFSCDLRAQYQLIGDSENHTHVAQVLNISANGIGLQVSQPLEAGVLLSLDLLDRDGQSIRSILACVVHTTLRVGGELAVGCNFIRALAEDELSALL
jgi:hypothetical protein